MKASVEIKVRIQAALGVLTVLAVSFASLSGEDLWVDHNPYSSAGSIRTGTILKLVVEEPIKAEYEYNRKLDENATIKITPDKSITDFLPPADTDKSITGKDKVKIKAKGLLSFRMAVTVTAKNEGGTLKIRGGRSIAYESGRARQRITVSGSVNRQDVSANRIVHSSEVADLAIVIVGSPIPQTDNIRMKQIPGSGGTMQPKAELSEEEKQRLLLDYLNRLLGESR